MQKVLSFPFATASQLLQLARHGRTCQMPNLSDNVHFRHEGCVPVQSSVCPHVMCIECVNNTRLSLSENKRIRTWIKCPFCNESKAFNADKPTVCLTMIEMIRIQEKGTAEKGNGTNESKKRPSSQESSEDANRKRQRLLMIAKSTQKTCRCCKQPKGEKHFSKKQWKESTPLCLRCTEKGKKQKRDAQSSKDCQEEKSLAEKECRCCKRGKHENSFSQREWKKESSLCLRCYEKGKMQKEQKQLFEANHDGPNVRIMLAKHSGTEAKLLSTVIAYTPSSAPYIKKLPIELVLDGYTDGSWAASDDGIISNFGNGAWHPLHLRSIDKDLSGFLGSLKNRRKAAYGTFVLSNRTDGFFVVPFDQPDPPEFLQPLDGAHYLFCKCVWGLNLVGTETKQKGATGNVSNGELKSASGNVVEGPENFGCTEVVTTTNRNDVPGIGIIGAIDDAYVADVAKDAAFQAINKHSHEYSETERQWQFLQASPGDKVLDVDGQFVLPTSSATNDTSLLRRMLCAQRQVEEQLTALPNSLLKATRQDLNPPRTLHVWKPTGQDWFSQRVIIDDTDESTKDLMPSISSDRDCNKSASHDADGNIVLSGETLQQSLAAQCLEEEAFCKCEKLSTSELRRYFCTAQRNQQTFLNSDSEIRKCMFYFFIYLNVCSLFPAFRTYRGLDPVDLVKTHRNYAINEQKYNELATRSDMNSLYKGVVVLDLFAGIGSGEVALKRLGIAIDKVRIRWRQQIREQTGIAYSYSSYATVFAAFYFGS